jgi:hypothetical protein
VISTEKPGSPAELVHFGVKGMQWGVHKTQGTRNFYAKNPTSKQRSAAIDKARANVQSTKSAYKAEEKGSAKRAALKKEHKTNPDTATALRLKRGEKIALGIIATQGYLPVTALAAQVGVTARVGKRRALEA